MCQSKRMRERKRGKRVSVCVSEQSECVCLCQSKRMRERKREKGVSVCVSEQENEREKERDITLHLT